MSSVSSRLLGPGGNRTEREGVADWGFGAWPPKERKIQIKIWFPSSYIWSFLSFSESVIAAQISISGGIPPETCQDETVDVPCNITI